MRPQNLEEFRGQHRLLQEGALLQRSLKNDRIPSMIFWGPPGCGKTSLAEVIRLSSSSRFLSLSAVSSGIKEVKAAIAEATQLKGSGKKTILFIDEIHRFNKSQQDALLQAVEQGTITLIGATTENPSFEVNNALLSRCQLVLFSPLDETALTELFWSALRDHPRGLKREIDVDAEVISRIVSEADGDARYLLNQLEWIEAALPEKTVAIDLDFLKKIHYEKPLRYDKSGDQHFNIISAFHKSIRGSDPDAALYWMHRMLQAGEDPRYLLRRMIRIASEDVGLADPQALVQATAARGAYDFLGIPEGVLALDQLAVYLALAPKSNSLEVAAANADRLVRSRGDLPVPRAFRNAVNKTGRDLGYGKGYLYDHDSADGYTGQDHLPIEIQGQQIYTPSNHGFEQKLAQRMQWLQEKRQSKPEDSAVE